MSRPGPSVLPGKPGPYLNGHSVNACTLIGEKQQQLVHGYFRAVEPRHQSTQEIVEPDESLLFVQGSEVETV